MIDVTDDQARERVAKNVNRLLAERGWSGRELARKTGDEPNTINRLRRAANDVRLGVIIRVASALETTVDDLVGANQFVSPST